MNEEDPVYGYAYNLTNALKLLDESRMISEKDKQPFRRVIRHGTRSLK